MAGSSHFTPQPRTPMLFRLLAAILLLTGPALAGPALAGEEEDACRAAIAEVRVFAETLPGDDLSRRYAEVELETARIEMENNEAEDCPDFVENARRILETRPYRLRPGEILPTRGRDLPR